MVKGESRTFSVDTNKDPQTLVEETRQVAEENNATFKGDTNLGSLSSKGVAGNYEVGGRTVKITITDKPKSAS
jgi:hypothetical protein